MESGSQELSRTATAYIASLAFVATFLLTTAWGGDGNTALLRGVLVGAMALVLGRFLARPIVDVVLDAMARDRAANAPPSEEEDDR